MPFISPEPSFTESVVVSVITVEVAAFVEIPTRINVSEAIVLLIGASKLN